MKKFYFAMAMASALTFIPAAIPFDSSPGVTVAEAAAAPDADLTNLRDDSATSIATLSADKPLFLNFWASWCPPCVGEMPHIDAMYQKYGDRVNFAAVSIDGSTDDAKSFTQGRGADLQLPFYYGDEMAISQAYHIDAIPISMMIAPGGEIIAQHLGGMTEEELDAFISAAL